MKIPIGVLSLLLASASFSQELSQEPVRLPDIPLNKISVQGIARMGGELYASISIGSRTSAWCKEGESVGRFKIVAVDENSVKLVDAQSKESNSEFTKYLDWGKVKAAGDAKEPARYSRAWVNSKANPMLYHTTPLPSEVAMNWSKLPKEQREEIIAFYRQHGWQLLYSESNDGITSSFSWENIYEKERHEVIKANSEAFVASLNEEQRAKWNEIGATPPLKLNGRPPTPEDLAEGRRRKDRFAAFKATLSAAQLDAYEARGDFTKHDWSQPLN